MITITEAAAEKIKELTPDPKYALRMRVVGGGCSGLQYQMGLEDEQNGTDKVLTSNGVKVLVDMKSALYLAGAEVDYINGLMGIRLQDLQSQRPRQRAAAGSRSANPRIRTHSPHERYGALGAAAFLPTHSASLLSPVSRLYGRVPLMFDGFYNAFWFLIVGCLFVLVNLFVSSLIRPGRPERGKTPAVRMRRGIKRYRFRTIQSSVLRHRAHLPHLRHRNRIHLSLGSHTQGRRSLRAHRNGHLFDHFGGRFGLRMGQGRPGMDQAAHAVVRPLALAATT